MMLAYNFLRNRPIVKYSIYMILYIVINNAGIAQLVRAED